MSARIAAIDYFLPSAILTRVTSDPMLPFPVPSQSPTHRVGSAAAAVPADTVSTKAAMMCSSRFNCCDHPLMPHLCHRRAGTSTRALRVRSG